MGLLHYFVSVCLSAGIASLLTYLLCKPQVSFIPEPAGLAQISCTDKSLLSRQTSDRGQKAGLTKNTLGTSQTGAELNDEIKPDDHLISDSLHLALIKARPNDINLLRTRFYQGSQQQQSFIADQLLDTGILNSQPQLLHLLLELMYQFEDTKLQLRLLNLIPTLSQHYPEFSTELHQYAESLAATSRDMNVNFSALMLTDSPAKVDKLKLAVLSADSDLAHLVQPLTQLTQENIDTELIEIIDKIAADKSSTLIKRSQAINLLQIWQNEGMIND